MNAAKVTLTTTVLAAAFGLVLGLSAVPSDSYACNTGENHKTGEACGGGGGGNVTNPDDILGVPCGDLFDLNGGSCGCLFDVNVGIVNGNPAMKITLGGDCTTDTMLVLPNFLDPAPPLVPNPNPNFPSLFDNCGEGANPDCPPSDTQVFLNGGENTLTAESPFSGDAVITNSTNRGDIQDITIDIEASSAGCEGSPESAIIFDRDGVPILSDFFSQTWLRILGTTVRVTGDDPLCNAIVIQNDLVDARATIVHNSIVEPKAYTDVGMLFFKLRMFDLGTNTNIGVGSSTIGRPADGFSGTAVKFDQVDRGLIGIVIIENEDDEGDDVVGTGVLVVDSLEFTIKNNTIKGGDVGIQVGPATDGLITKNTIVGDGPDAPPANSVGICVDPSATVTIRKNNSVIGYVTPIDLECP